MSGHRKLMLVLEDCCAEVVRDRYRAAAPQVRYDEHDLTANAIHAVRAAQNDVQSDRALPYLIYRQSRAEDFTEPARGDEIDFEVDRRQSVLLFEVIVGERQLQPFTEPIFHEVIEHGEVTRVEDHLRRIAVGEANQDLRAIAAGLSHAALPGTGG